MSWHHEAMSEFSFFYSIGRSDTGSSVSNGITKESLSVTQLGIINVKSNFTFSFRSSGGYTVYFNMTEENVDLSEGNKPENEKSR